MKSCLSSIRTNFIQNQAKTVKPRQAPWITETVKVFLRKKNHAYAHFMKNGQPNNKLEGIQKMISDGAKMIEDAKKTHHCNVGQKLANPET